jgi:tripartite-type tricarboxylate transporter receptor subunit TctC
MKIHFVLAVLGLITNLLSPAHAQGDQWPSRPIKLIVGYPPGGTTDIAARLLAVDLSKKIGQQVIVENKPGAGGTVAATFVVRSAPDGYTLLMAASPEVSIAPIIFKSLQYDPIKDLVPISLVGQVPFLLVIHPAVPAKNLSEFIDYAKANPGKLNYSSFGNNTSNHLAGELFKSLTNINTIHIPYKGSGPSITDLVAGQIQYTFDAPPAVMEQVRANKLKALAVSSQKRLPLATDIPTFSESGLESFTAGTWFGILAPASTPQAIINKINLNVIESLNGSDITQAFTDRNILPSGNSSIEFSMFIKSEVAKWKKLADQVGIIPE